MIPHGLPVDSRAELPELPLGQRPRWTVRHGSFVLDSLNSPKKWLTRRECLVERLSDCQAEWPEFEPCLSRRDCRALAAGCERETLARPLRWHEVGANQDHSELAPWSWLFCSIRGLVPHRLRLFHRDAATHHAATLGAGGEGQRGIKVGHVCVRYSGLGSGSFSVQPVRRRHTGRRSAQESVDPPEVFPACPDPSAASRRSARRAGGCR